MHNVFFYVVSHANFKCNSVLVIIIGKPRDVLNFNIFDVVRITKTNAVDDLKGPKRPIHFEKHDGFQIAR